MENHTLLTSYISNLKLDLIMADYNLCSTEWKDLNYTPDYSKLYFICEGEGWLKIGDREYYPQPGELFLMPEGVQQSYSCISSKPFLKYWCHFSVRSGDINLFKILELSHTCSAVDPEVVKEMFSSIVLHVKSGEIYAQLLAKSKLMELFSYYLSKLDPTEITLKNLSSVEKLTKILNHIETNIEQNITIHELAEIAHMHPNYFIRLFKKQLGVPPIQYITRKKIDKAKELLTSTTSTISEIAVQLGFSDMFYFSKQFKKNAGLAPTDFRKQMQLLPDNKGV
ncbi:AraC family transcriptional regulator [Paenibacillus sp. HW567]|uniref:AraC family transcriptional regulator n=1 Tax=Paenibacillus sp. HW567 TaxID=1034769 RepID=UPI000380C67A|nr:AraC family transcriptional regulator [Paenibacillus sp. HW567]